MTMASQNPFLLGLLAEEFLHPGSGQSTGVIDLPVAREGHSGWPLVPDTGLKGALKEHDEGEAWVRRVYGSDTVEDLPDGSRVGGAGEALIGGARLLLLPVRHLEGTYAWVTCPALLERLWRDWLRLFGQQVFADDAPTKLRPTGNDRGKIRTKLQGLAANAKLHLEDLAFTVEGLDVATNPAKSLVDGIQRLMGDSPAAHRLPDQIAVVTDVIFNEFARWALPVQARNVLDDHKLSKNLWYEETLPPDTLLYAPIVSRQMIPSPEYTAFAAAFDHPQDRYRRVGGNESVGQGWVRVTRVAPPALPAQTQGVGP
jgi:CRISPR-associated protein Cmr4